VDDVEGGEHDLDRSPGRDVDLVGGDDRVGIPQLPPPVAAFDLDGERRLGRWLGEHVEGSERHDERAAEDDAGHAESGDGDERLAPPNRALVDRPQVGSPAEDGDGQEADHDGHHDRRDPEHQPPQALHPSDRLRSGLEDRGCILGVGAGRRGGQADEDGDERDQAAASGAGAGAVHRSSRSRRWRWGTTV
jgi:hypothetical protein